MKWLGRVLSVSVVAALLAAFGLVVALPAINGASTLTVLTGSMEPTIKPGALVAVKPVDPASIQVGDVVTFRPQSDSDDLITHRVTAIQVGAEGTAWVTQGDANNAPDEPIVAEQLRGRVMYALPYLGWVRQALQTAGPALFVGIGLVMIIALLWPVLRRGKTQARDGLAPEHEQDLRENRAEESGEYAPTEVSTLRGASS